VRGPHVNTAVRIVAGLLLIAFWDAWLTIGVAIDVALIVIAVSRPGWTDALRGRGNSQDAGRAVRSPT
jgi:hypothetical protein